jgi:hypothetical protein
MVVVLDPLPDDDQGFLKTEEDLPNQKVIHKGAIKAFTKAIFPKAAGSMYTSRQCQITNCVAL